MTTREQTKTAGAPKQTKKPKRTSTPRLSPREYPQYVKYMGSKSKLLQFVINGIASVHVPGRPVCDLFAGSCSLSGAIGDKFTVISNDIQAYSGVLAQAYLTAYRPIDDQLGSPERVLLAAEALVTARLLNLPADLDSTRHTKSISDFKACERRNLALIDSEFGFRYHLFTKYYSGTWWSAHQCLWIDALREVADTYREQPYYPVIITSLMHAMAYASQGTGHYAQYRDANTNKAMLDIATYRSRSVRDFFLKKYTSALSWIPTEPPTLAHQVTTLDFNECLATIPPATVYADPPYCFVHYSRFYHALETLVLYDFPPIQRIDGKFVKGRYREDRHQSPFCIATQVRGAFTDMFRSIRASGSNLVLSYSNTGMIELKELIALSKSALGAEYQIRALDFDHVHMTMGRRKDRQRNVKECLITAKRRIPLCQV